jgi:HlyD family secretion protein
MYFSGFVPLMSTGQKIENTRSSILLGTAAVLVLSGIWGSCLLPTFGSVAGQPLRASGHIEGTTVRIASLVGGRVKEVNTKEGAAVKAGQVLFRLDDADTRIKLEGSNRVLAKLLKEETQIRDLLRTLQSESTAQVKVVARSPSAGQNSTRPLAAAAGASGDKNHKDFLSQQTQLLDDQLKNELDALTQEEATTKVLVATSVKTQRLAIDEGFAAKRQALDEGAAAKLAAVKPSWLLKIFAPQVADKERAAINEVVTAKRDALSEAYKAVVKSLDTSAATQCDAVDQSFLAKRTAFQEVFATKKAALNQVAEAETKMQAEAQTMQTTVQQQLQGYGTMMRGLATNATGAGGMQQVVLKAAQERIVELRALLLATQIEIEKTKTVAKELTYSLTNYTLTSPMSGICESCNIATGEMCAPSQALATVIDPTAVHVRVFVPEGKIAALKVGQRATVFVDGASSQPLEAQVVSIDAQASFTPENVSLPEDRVKQVFGIQLQILQPRNIAKPGMSADVEFATTE